MIRTLTLTILAALSLVLTGCDTTTEPTAQVDPPIPTGAQAPRTVLQVIAGTKAAPVDTPVVKITWWHADTVGITLQAYHSAQDALGVGGYFGEAILPNGQNKQDSSGFVGLTGSPAPRPLSVPSDSHTFKIPSCKDSAYVIIKVTSKSIATSRDSAWVYCHH